jgi:hypothetical protein
MSIRMPSVRTGHRVSTEGRLQGTLRRRVSATNALIVSALLGIVLAGCATGDADDARRFQAQEAERTAVLPEVQATELATRFAVATPETSPTSTPIPLLARLMLTNSPGGSTASSNQLRSIPAYSSGTIYATAQVSNLVSGQVVAAIWATESGDFIAQQELTATGSGSEWFSFPLQLTGSLGPGVYSVSIWVEGAFLDSLSFTVG